MKIEREDRPKSQVVLTIELSAEELTPYLEVAARELSEQKSIPGFRSGHVPYPILVQRFGDQAILQHAVSAIVGKSFYEAAEKENLDFIDQPSIDIQKVAAGNPFVYKATLAVLPKVEVADFRELSVKPLPKIEVKQEEIDKVINDLRKMRAKEVLVERAAKIGDRVEVDFETVVDGVAIPGGKAEKYPLVLGDGQMIPGFEDNAVGLKAGEEKEFELSFPKDYHSENLKGKKAKFKVKMLAVYQIDLPELNEEFTKGLGLKTVEDLTTHISRNLEMEKQAAAEQKQDVAIVNLLIDKSKFGDLPDVLVNNEAHKMVHELEDNVERQGLKFADYLNHLKKKESDLLLDFAPDAVKRVKTALVIRQLALNEKISASEEEIHAEIDKTLNSYRLNPQYASELVEIEKNIESESSHRYFANLLTNRKVLALLKTTMVK
jgi:trigger factor